MDIAHLDFLVAEADPEQSRALVDMLARLGAGKVSAVPDGQSALFRLAPAIVAGADGADGDAAMPAIDIAIIDLALPGIDGLELIRHLAELKCRAAVIIFAAQSSAILFLVETMAEAYGIDLLGTIVKPIMPQKLDTLISHYIPQNEQPREPPEPEFSFSEVGFGLQEGQFEPFFQPQVELETGHVKGLEMFARWRHPQYGVLGPNAFIKALEQRLDFLDWSMIEKSVAACRVLHDQAMPTSMSINVAPLTLAHAGFIEQMNACLARHNIAACDITFEIPESAVLTSEPHFLERLLRLRMQGFGLAIDDYGSGQLNLQLLARIPFSQLKIERDFVSAASKKRALGTVLGSCLGLAHDLERRSVAVGVETREDWDFLQALGCTYGQGYYIAKPMALAEFPGWLQEWRHYF